MKTRVIGRIAGLAALAVLAVAAAPSTAPAAADRALAFDVPLIFVPGITGSRMEREGKELWPRINDLVQFPRDRFLLDLRLAADGVHEFDSATPAVATDIIRSRGYEDTIKHLEELGYTEGVDLFVFPFDWRKSAKVNAERLLHFVEETHRCDTCKVDILAHSQGGLVTSWMLLDPESVGKVRRVVTLGSPVLGAAKALGVLEYRTPCFIEASFLHICIVNPATLQETVTNMPGVYELLPSRAYHSAVMSPLTIDPDLRGSGAPPDPKTYAEWTAIVKRDRNAALVDQADAFHATLDDFKPRDPDVEMRRVVGMKHETIARIREYHRIVCVGGRFAQCHRATEHDFRQGNGDGTVPLNSADMQNVSNGFDHRNGIPNRYFDENHMGLATSPVVLRWAFRFFRGSASRAAAPTGDEEEGFDVPETGPALELDVLGDAAGLVTDFAGNSMGIDPATEVADEQIPGGNFHAVDSLESFTLSRPGMFTADLTASGGGEIRIRARSYQDSALIAQAVFDLASQPVGAKFRLALVSGETFDNLRLQVDSDGDGTFEKSLAPTGKVSGAAAAETVPPETCAGATILLPGISIVRFAVDDLPDGSGGAATYLLPAGFRETTWNEHPFLMFMFSSLQYRSIDNAGNIEDVKTLVVDDAPNCRQLADPLFDRGFFHFKDGTQLVDGTALTDATTQVGTTGQIDGSTQTIDGGGGQTIDGGNVESVDSGLVVSSGPIMDVDHFFDGDHFDGGSRVKRTIAPQGDEDWFRFQANGVSTYRLSLSGLRADYDLELYDPAGTLVLASQRRGKLSEEIRSRLASGRYYVRVVGFSGAYSAVYPYQLTLETLWK